MKKKLYPVGRLFYQLAGFTKAIVIHLTAVVFGRLKALAKKEERSVQVTARRILEKHLEPKGEPKPLHEEEKTKTNGTKTNGIKNLFLKVLFVVLLGSGRASAMGRAHGTAKAPETNGTGPGDVNEPRVIVKGSSQDSESDRGKNSSQGPQSRSVTPGGMMTTSGGSGANISNTPSNITPATTPPLQ